MNQELRPGEKATNKYIENQRKNQGILKTGINLATSAIGIAGATKVFPFLNNLIPSSLALQGLKKVDKKIGGFIEKTMENGFSGEDILGFLREQFSPKQQSQSDKQNQPTQQANPLQQFETNYPEIAKALQGYIQQGQSPDAAAGILKTSSAFGNKIAKVEKDTGKNFIDYVLELFGGPQSHAPSQQASPQQPTQQPNQTQQPGGLNPQILQIINGIRTEMQNLSGTP